MKKAFFIINAFILLLGVSGCGSVPTAQETQSRIDAANASNIALAINAYNALRPSAPLGMFDDDITLEEAEEKLTGDGLWQPGLSDEEERAAWELIVYNNEYNIAYLTPEADQALYGEKTANALALVRGINNYKYSDPHDMLPENVALIEVKEALEKDGFWPSYMTDAEAGEAWALIEINNGEAELTPDAREALQRETRYESDRIKIANASTIVEGINVYNALNPNNDRLPDDITLAEVKEALETWGLWPLFLTDTEADNAWKMIEIEDGEARIKGVD